jgi:coenzyme F420-reducing hydrogenase delta subunit
MEAAGSRHLSYDARVIPIRVPCLGRISTGIILKAFEQGALGVLLLGCPEEACQYNSGLHLAQNVVSEAKKILFLLGYSQSRLRLDSLEAGAGQIFSAKISQFLIDLESDDTGESKSMQKADRNA